MCLFYCCTWKSYWDILWRPVESYLMLITVWSLFAVHVWIVFLHHSMHLVKALLCSQHSWINLAIPKDLVIVLTAMKESHGCFLLFDINLYAIKLKVPYAGWLEACNGVYTMPHVMMLWYQYDNWAAVMHWACLVHCNVDCTSA